MVSGPIVSVNPIRIHLYSPNGCFLGIPQSGEYGIRSADPGISSLLRPYFNANASDIRYKDSGQVQPKTLAFNYVIKC